MMRAKADPKATSNSILVLSCLLLAGAVVGFLAPKPGVAVVVANERRETKKLETSSRAAQDAVRLGKATVLARTWTGEPATIQAQVVNLTTSLAKKYGVSWLRLQPQKGMANGELEQISFLLVVEGPFPAVAALERDLEISANRLAVSVFQVSSADSESDKVSASIGLVAHRAAANVEETKGNAKRT